MHKNEYTPPAEATPSFYELLRCSEKHGQPILEEVYDANTAPEVIQIIRALNIPEDLISTYTIVEYYHDVTNLESAYLEYFIGDFLLKYQ